MPHPHAGKPAPEAVLIDPVALRRQYYSETPDIQDPEQRVSFGTSGHRGSAARRSFNEAHILAISQAICEYRAKEGTNGPLFLGMDTHALSEPAQQTALEVLAAQGVSVLFSKLATPTPVISHAILSYNKGRTSGWADGIVVTPSHNPPEDGGFKYNPPNGGPADANVTGWIEKRANELLATNNVDVKRIHNERMGSASHIKTYDFVRPYVMALADVIDFKPIQERGITIGADPLGGSSVDYWDPIAEQYGLSLKVVNPVVDPTFRFMPLDHDGKIRMDCSSPYAMANLVRMKDQFNVSFGNDTDADRHGIVTPSAGLMNPNHYLAVAIHYLFQNRPEWSPSTAIGKTLVSSSLIDRVGAALGRKVVEVPVGFKWFVQGLLDGSLGFGGEESAGGSFLRRDGTVWSTDKDGIILDLLAAEMMAKTGRDPGELLQTLVAQLGMPYYTRIDEPASPAQKALLKKLSPESVWATKLAGDPITARLTRAPGNGAEIGGLKVVTHQGWFAARPSGTENIYKIYAESFQGQAHLEALVQGAREIIAEALAGVP